MNKTRSAWNFVEGSGGLWLSFGMGGGVFALSWWLRSSSTIFDLLLFTQLQFTSGILAITFAAAALVRFRGSRERLPLILACGFVIVGLTLASSSFFSFRLSDSESNLSLRDPMTWVIGRTLLGLLLVSALVVERRLPTARHPGRELLMALILVVLSASILSAAHVRLPAGLVLHPGEAFPRPGNLVPAGLFCWPRSDITGASDVHLLRLIFPSTLPQPSIYGALLLPVSRNVSSTVLSPLRGSFSSAVMC